MTDKYREALAHACAEHLKSGGDVISEAAFASGWQACAAYYAPKLTKTEAVEVCRDVYRHARKGELWPGIVAALRAAGVKFAEEA
jgi:hypothetical protein